MRSIIVSSLFCILALCSAALSQSPHVSVGELQKAVAELSTPDEIQFVAGLNLEVAALRCLNEYKAYGVKHLAFVEYVGDRMSGSSNFDKTKPRLALLDEIHMAIPSMKKGSDFLGNCSTVVPATEKRQDFIAFTKSMKNAERGVTSTIATLYSTSRALRLSDLALAKADAVLAGKQYDSTKDTPILKLALNDMNESIRYDPLKKYYVERAEVLKRLGDTAAANADIAKAATMAN